MPCRCEARTSALCWKEEEDLLINIKFKRASPHFHACAVLNSCKKVTGEHRLQWGFNKPLSMPGFLRVLKSDFSIQEGSLGLYGPIAECDLVSTCPSTLFSILSQQSHLCPISHGRVMRCTPMFPQVGQRSPSALGDVEIVLG